MVNAELCQMNILVVAATDMEISSFRRYLDEKKYQRRNCQVELLITGVSMMNAVYRLTKYLSIHKPDIAIQAGVGGSFHPFYPPGALVVIKDEIVVDTGVEESGTFRDLFDMGLMESQLPFTGKVLNNPYSGWLEQLKLNKVSGASVNEITTRPERIQLLQEKYGVVIESMEGAAFHYVCLQENVPFIQMRAVSNFVGERDKAKWRLKEAIENLNEEMSQFVHKLLC